MKTPVIHNTRIAILDAAERLFAARGFKSTSLRAITALAGANLGAVNYHFASKDSLILAVLIRRLKPLNERGTALLDQFERESGRKPVKLEKIIEAMFRPALELIAKPSQGGRNFLRLLAYTLSESGKFLKPLLEEQFAEKNRRFHKCLMKTLPGLSASETYWKMHFSYGVFVHTISHPHILEISSHNLCKLEDTENTLEQIVAFCAAGFRNSKLTSKQKS
ncbi:MAG: TetR/AcrR family transcriptional regulator [Verrucomicrobiota bacterium]